MCDILIWEGADVHKKDTVGETALQTACDAPGRNSHGRVVRLLLAAGADPNVLAMEEYRPLGVMYPVTPLQMACKHNKRKVVRDLLEFGVQIELTEPYQRRAEWWTTSTSIRESIDEHRRILAMQAFAMAGLSRLARDAPAGGLNRDVINRVLEHYITGTLHGLVERL
jgi:hypothetical protein